VDIYKLENQMIQCRTEVIDNIRGSTEGIKRDSDGLIPINERMSNVSIFMGDSHVAVELFETRLHVFEVLLGPFNFRPNKG
jgi:hypothetical protein